MNEGMKNLPKVRSIIAGSALACLTLAGAIGAASPASATAQAAQTATGTLTLNSGGAFPVTFSYTSCQPPVTRRPRLFGISTFDNRPLPGCQVVLHNVYGKSTVLCEGQGEMPVGFRDAPSIVIQPGMSPSCVASAG